MKAFEIYNKDMLSSNKKYTLNNIPAAYAVMLWTWKTTTVSTGTLYTDRSLYGNQINYDTIVNLMKNRIEYVSGGQAQRSYWLPTDGKMDNSDVGFTAQVKSTLQYVMVKTSWQLTIQKVLNTAVPLVR